MIRLGDVIPRIVIGEKRFSYSIFSTSSLSALGSRFNVELGTLNLERLAQRALNLEL
jgi:hypothetical protein